MKKPTICYSLSILAIFVFSSIILAAGAGAAKSQMTTNPYSIGISGALYCDTGCGGTCSSYCIRTNCPHVVVTGCPSCNAYCTRTCNKATCGAECRYDSDCTADYCAGTCGTGTNSCIWRDYFCDTSACTKCSCTYTAYDADASSSYCTGCKGSGYWALGGEGSGNCCGDDSNEYVITEKSSADAPAGYNDGGKTCCDTSS